MTAPLTAGQEIVSGRVFRRLPNYQNRFDYHTGRPKIGAFRPQTADGGELSAHLEALASQDTILRLMAGHPRYRAFGLCALSVEEIRASLGKRTRVILSPDPTDTQLGFAHVVLTGCDDDVVQGILASLAQVLRRPVGSP